MNSRFINFEGVHNFRDVGGLPTICGGHVKKGFLYRSARLSNVSQSDIDLIKDLNIKVILDYRFYDEMLENPNVVIDDVNINVIPAFKTRTKHSRVAVANFLENGDITHFESGLLDEYRQLPFNNQSYQFLFNELKRYPSYSLLHHCTVGRDRTGVASALVLKLLNVDDEVIKKDYILSNDALISFFKTMNETLDISDEAREELIEALKIKEHYLDFIYQLILDKYDSFEEYFESEYNITASDIIKLREHYIRY